MPLPRAEQIRSAELLRFSLGAPMAIEVVRAIFVEARVLSSVMDGWSYSPWYLGTVDAGEGPMDCQLFLGGRGRIAGTLFEFDPKIVPEAPLP